MRNRFRKRDKTIFFFMIILIVILLLGIGYAIVQVTLSLTGSASVLPLTDIDVYFSNSSSSGDGQIQTEIDSVDKTQASFTITDLVGYGDTAYLEYTIQNDSSVPVNLEITSSTLTNDTYFSMESNMNDLNKITLAAGESEILHIQVKVIKVYVGSEGSTIDANASITVHAKVSDSY